MKPGEGPLPDRVTVAEGPHHDPRYAWINVSLDGVEQKDVIEYCVSGGWIVRYRRAEGLIVHDNGVMYSDRVTGKVDVWWRCD